MSTKSSRPPLKAVKSMKSNNANLGAAPPAPEVKAIPARELCMRALIEAQGDLVKAGDKYFGAIVILFNGSEVLYRQSSGHPSMVGPTVAALETTKALMYSKLFAPQPVAAPAMLAEPPKEA